MTKSLIGSLIVLAFVVLFFWFVWVWGFERFYVGPNEMAIITAKGGKSLPKGQILAQRDQKGVWADVLGEGRHFLNPILYDREIRPVIEIKPGKVGLVTSKVGQELPPGEFLAEPGQKGVWRHVLSPGKYRLNPVGYQLEIVDALSIPIGYAGVLTSLSGQPAAEGEFAQPHQKGVRADILQPGLYYINPREFKVDVLEIGINQVSLLGKGGGAVITKSQIVTQNRPMEDLQNKALLEQNEKRADYLNTAGSMLKQMPAATAGRAAGERELRRRAEQSGQVLGEKELAQAVAQMAQQGAANTFVLNQFLEFPSRDGFDISLDLTVEFELPPTNIAWIFRSYGDLPAVVDKIIMPQILSVARLKGSSYGAKDFIVGEGRELFQKDLTETLGRALAEKRLIVHNALIRHVNVPEQILDPIQQASMAVEQDLTNKEKQNTAKKQAELNTELSLIQQRGEQVAQETEKLKAEIRAEQVRSVAQIGAETLKRVAVIQQDTAGARAERTKKLGQAEAEVVRRVEGEKATGFQLKIKAFGDPIAYSLHAFATNLNEKVNINILHAGPGTLWTDLEKASLGSLGGAKLLQAPVPENTPPAPAAK